MMYDSGYMILAAILMGISALVSQRLKSKFAHYSQMPTSSGLSGKEIAEKMLADSGINDVEVIQVNGQLTDHYNPMNKTVNLSEVVYNERNVAAAAVAAHEVGHAVQHATAYQWLEMRSRIVPALKITSKIDRWVIMIGLGMAVGGGNSTVLMIGLMLMAIGVLFSFVTLPVEFDASNRALAWLDTAGITHGEEHEGAKDALNWAARTYIVAAVGSLATLLYYIWRFMGSRD